MARRTTVTMVDDLDGSEGPDIMTVQFGLDGEVFEVDVKPQHYDQLTDFLERFIAAGRRVPRGNVTSITKRRGSQGKRKAPIDPGQGKAMRQFAWGNGMQCPKTGRIPNEVIDAFNAAHSARSAAH